MTVLSQTYDHLTIDTAEKLASIDVDLSQHESFVNGELVYYPNFLSHHDTALYTLLEQQLAWQQGQIKMFGKLLTIPRLQAWYGDKHAKYRYSGVMMNPLPWHWALRALKQHCQKATNSEFNSVLANFYRHQQDSMGWHSDNEKELGDKPLIASLSFGYPRRFCLRHKSSGEKLQLPLKSGSLLVMQGSLQQHWQHALPKSKRAMSGRINLTFRQIIAARQ